MRFFLVLNVIVIILLHKPGNPNSISTLSLQMHEYASFWLKYESKSIKLNWFDFGYERQKVFEKYNLVMFFDYMSLVLFILDSQ